MASAYTLEFEKPLLELERQIEDLKRIGSERQIDIDGELDGLQGKLESLRAEIYRNLTPIQRVMVARHPRRPYTLDYLSTIFTDFIELHGDRLYMDDPAIVGGWARLAGVSVMVIGHQKGRDTKENLKRNFGMPHPEGYRKALRLMKLAAKFGAPVITLIDTPGAYPGLGAEERGQSEALARNILEMSALPTPVRGGGHRRGRLGRRARARRGRPGAHAGELGLLGDLARRLRGDPVEGREPARARGGGAEDHGRGPPPAQGHRRDRPGAGRAARTSTPTPPARRSARR